MVRLISDNEIVEGCRKGLRKYQYLLYDRYASKLLSVCMRYAGNRTEAEEMLQEGLIRVFKNISTVRMNSTNCVYYWMKRIIINTALNYLRDNKKYRFLEPVDKIDENISDLSEKEESGDWFEKIELDEIMQIIQSLPTGYKTVFTLYSIEEYSHYEISEMLGISVNTSKTQLMKARKAIIQKIKENNKELYLKKIC
jgi:RNA polymerase sigma factor (sigma-70 family)